MRAMLFCVFGIVFLVSCSSDVYMKKVLVISDPSSAVARIGESSCRTPCKIPVLKAEEYDMRVSKEGFQEIQVVEKKTLGRKIQLF